MKDYKVLLEKKKYEAYTKKRLEAEIKKSKDRIEYLDDFIKCKDCGKYVHIDELGEDEAWSTLCKKCVAY